jgi:hypothetical protein
MRAQLYRGSKKLIAPLQSSSRNHPHPFDNRHTHFVSHAFLSPVCGSIKCPCVCPYKYVHPHGRLIDFFTRSRVFRG